MATTDDVAKMRLWSLHPKYLDSKGLLGAWREGLLAQKVLEEKTKGYRNHPQLIRFKRTKNPLAQMGAYLFALVEEATQRNYRFDATKIVFKKGIKLPSMPVTRAQMQYETEHLLNKLKLRDPERFQKLKGKTLKTHPLFYRVPGPIEAWEKVL